MTAEPMTNPAATQGLARVVYDLENQYHPAPRNQGPPTLNEVLELAELMRTTAGDSLDGTIDQIWAASESIDHATNQIVNGPADTDDLLDIDPQTLTNRVLNACRDRAARETLAHQVAHHYREALARVAGTKLKDAADAVVASMAKDFAKHAKVIHTAANAGLSDNLEIDDLLTKGTTQQIDAYRELPEAVDALEQIANRRNQMARVLRYGPVSPCVASFVTGIGPGILPTAQSRYDGDLETVQYNVSTFGTAGSALTQVHTQRLGGRWLALANLTGVRLHLNTADEAHAVLANTKATK